MKLSVSKDRNFIFYIVIALVVCLLSIIPISVLSKLLGLGFNFENIPDNSGNYLLVTSLPFLFMLLIGYLFNISKNNMALMTSIGAATSLIVSASISNHYLSMALVSLYSSFFGTFMAILLSHNGKNSGASK